MPRLSAQDRLYRALLESTVQKTLTDTAEALGAPWHHEVDSRKSRRGLPDVITPVAPVLWVIECKKELEQLEPDQVRWAEALLACTRVEYRIARPSNVGQIVDEINASRGR